MSSAVQTAPDLADLRARVRRLESASTAVARVPVPPQLTSAFPHGLRAGATYSVIGSLTLATALLAESSQQGTWCGVVGLPDFGVEAAARMGVDLDRLILVPAAGEQWASVIAALTEVVPVILAQPARVAPHEVARLNARLRERGSTLLLTDAWPQATATLQVTTQGWEGLGMGHGHLTRRRLRIEVTHRGSTTRSLQFDAS